VGLIILSIIITGCGSSKKTNSSKVQDKQPIGTYITSGSQHSNEILELREDGTFIMQGNESYDTGKGAYTILNSGIKLDFDSKESFGGKYENVKTLSCTGTIINNTITVELPNSEKRTYIKKN